VHKSLAPIFGVADYGIVDGFQNVIPISKEKTEIKRESSVAPCRLFPDMATSPLAGTSTCLSLA
jgi:hypothetical protein